ncbi:porin family protein [Aliivibrio salmonicida]|uniref:porin family protein n=1 Tax=Aliivibrio salmonicida TaxID=40269 RepID=UPI003D138971
MRQLYLLLTILFSISAHADKSGYYITTNIENSSVTFLGSQTDLDGGYNIKGGYDFPISDTFYMSVELEYNNMGRFDFDWRNKNQYATSHVDAHFFGANLKYRAYMFESDFFITSMFGYGYYYLDMDVDFYLEDGQLGYIGNGSQSESALGLSYGFEAGYDLSKHITLTAGHNIARAIMDGIGYDFGTTYVGLTYNF